MKKLFALLLALLMVVSIVACGEEDDPSQDKVINIGVAEMTFTAEDTGDVFTYEYLNSTSIVITAFRAADYEPHVVTIPTSITVVTEKKGSGDQATMVMDIAAIGDQAFYAKSGISEIRFEADSKLTSIGAYAFANCEILESVVLPSGVTEIGESAFFGCTSLSSITLNEGLTTIGKAAFYNCSALGNITFPSTLTTIGESAFSDCSAMTELVLNEGLLTVGKQAFYNCDGILSVTLPASIEEIGLYAFSTQLRGYEIEVEVEPEEGTAPEGGEATAPEGGEGDAEEVEPETEIVKIEVVFNTVEGSYAADYIANPPTAEIEDAE